MAFYIILATLEHNKSGGGGSSRRMIYNLVRPIAFKVEGKVEIDDGLITGSVRSKAVINLDGLLGASMTNDRPKSRKKKERQRLSARRHSDRLIDRSVRPPTSFSFSLLAAAVGLAGHHSSSPVHPNISITSSLPKTALPHPSCTTHTRRRRRPAGWPDQFFHVGPIKKGPSLSWGMTDQVISSSF